MFTNMAQLLQLSTEFETFNNIRNLCRLCGNTTNPNRRFSIFSDYGKCVKLQRLISDFAKVSVKSDDCFPQHLCRKCYRTLLNLRDKVVAFQTKCATTKVNLSRGKEGVKRTRRSPKSSPSTSPAQRQKKSRLNTQSSSRKALFSDEKENLTFLSHVNDQKESVYTATDMVSPIVQSSSSCQLEPAQKRPMAENILQPSNPSSTSATSVVSAKESTINKDETRKALNVISIFGLNNPVVSLKTFLSINRGLI